MPIVILSAGDLMTIVHDHTIVSYCVRQRRVTWVRPAAAVTRRWRT